MEIDDPKEDDSSNTEATIQKMFEALSKQDTTTLKATMKTVQEESKSQFLVDYLVPLLFEAGAASEEALSLVGCLVSVDASTYLKPVSRSVKQEATLRASSEKPMVVSQQLLGVLIQQLNGADVEVSSNATEALMACCRKLGPSVSTPAMQSITATWRDAWENLQAGQDKMTTSTVCVRCCSAVVDLVSLGGSSDQLMDSAISSGALELLLEMASYEDDPLLQMSVLDLLEKLAVTQPMHHHRAKWLCSETVLSPLLLLSGAGTEEESGNADPVLGGPALRVLSAICRLGQRDNNVFDQGGKEALLGFHRALHAFEGSGELDRLALVDAISSFASASEDALDLVLNDEVTRDAWLGLSVAQPQLKASILTSVAMVIDPLPEKDVNGDIVEANVNNAPSNTAAMRLFSLVGQVNHAKDSTEVVLSFAKSPIPETRLSAYNLMRAVAKTSTGSQVLLSHSEFYSFLIDRERESTKIGREGKFAIVESIWNSPAKLLLAEDIVQTMDRILKQGPHFVPIQRPELVVE